EHRAGVRREGRARARRAALVQGARRGLRPAGFAGRARGTRGGGALAGWHHLACTGRHGKTSSMSLSEILAECARIAAGSSGAGAGALASVAKRHGSLPMSATAKMLVTAGGARIGTVGGGCLEAEIIERAHDVLQSRVPALSSHSLNAELAGDYGLTCGGTAEMLIEPVFADERLAAIYEEAAALMARGERALMVTGIDWSDGVVKAVTTEERYIGADNDLVRSAVREFDATSELPSLENGVLVEPISGKPRLVVFGAGHVGARLAEAAAFAGWRVTVADDRADFAEARRLPFAELVVTW